MKRLSVLLLCVLIALVSFSATGCKGKHELDLPEDYMIEGEINNRENNLISFRYCVTGDGDIGLSYGYKYSSGFEDMYIYKYIGGDDHQEYMEYVLKKTIYGFAVIKKTFMSEERCNKSLAFYQTGFSKMYNLIENEDYTATKISGDELVEDDIVTLKRFQRYGCEYYKLSKDGEDFYYEAAIDPDNNLTMYLGKIDAQKNKTTVIRITLYYNSCDEDINDILKKAKEVTAKHGDEL